MAEKLCGRIIPDVGVIIKYLASDNYNTYYWMPSTAFRDEDIVNIRTIKEAPSNGYPVPVGRGSPFVENQIDCGKNKIREGATAPWDRVQPIDDSTPWVDVPMNTAEKNFGQAVIKRVCSDPYIPARTLPELHEEKNGDLGISIEDAKLKCENIGFKKGSENFGKCVLELIK